MGGRSGLCAPEVHGESFLSTTSRSSCADTATILFTPLTLVSPASREEHLKHLKAARQAGFVYVRLHTHCELPEYL